MDSFNYMTRAYATSVIPMAIMAAIWCVWGLRHLCTGSGQIERRARILSQHTEASLLLSYLVGDAATTPAPSAIARASTEIVYDFKLSTTLNSRSYQQS